MEKPTSPQRAPGHRPLHLEQRHVPVPRQRHAGGTGAAGPGRVSCCRAALEQDTADLEFHRLEREAFAKRPNVAIDVAVMEKQSSAESQAAGCRLEPMSGRRWSASGKTRAKGFPRQCAARPCDCRRQPRLLSAYGTPPGGGNLVVVETDDAVLIADRSKAQEIKTVVKQPEAAGSPEGKAHSKIYRSLGALHRRHRRNPLQGETDLGNPAQACRCRCTNTGPSTGW